MKRTVVVTVLALLLGACSNSLLPIAKSQVQPIEAQSIEIEGTTIKLPCEFKLAGIQYQGKKPIALLRAMRAGENAETWFLQPAETAHRPGIGEQALIIRECTEIIRK